MKYAILIERTGPKSYCVSSPDIPCCVAVGYSRKEAVAYFRQALQQYLKDLRDAGRKPPRPTTLVDTIAVRALPDPQSAWPARSTAIERAGRHPLQGSSWSTAGCFRPTILGEIWSTVSRRAVGPFRFDPRVS